MEGAQDSRWYSNAAHLAGVDRPVVDVATALKRIDEFAAILGELVDGPMSYAALRKGEYIGHPIGSKAWLAAFEPKIGLSAAPKGEGQSQEASR